MRIAIIGHKRIPSNEGGIEKGVEQHAVRMVERGHEVDVYNRMGGDKYSGRHTAALKQYKGVNIITIPTFCNEKLNAVVYSFLATIRAAFGRYDIVSYRASGPCASIGLARLLGMKCVASLHGIDSQRSKWGKFASTYLRYGEKTAAKRANALMVLSENMRSYIKSEYGRDSILFCNGVDKPEIREPEEIAKFGLIKDNYILYLSRIVPEKAVHTLLAAFKGIDTEKKLVIAGGADNEQYLDYLHDMAQGDDRVIFTGYATGSLIEELYSNAYIFTLPSNLEGMSNSLLEALSYGNCCFLSDIPENVEPAGEYAEYFKAGDEEDCRLKLDALLHNPERVAELKSASADYVLDKYSWDRAVDITLDTYAKVVEQGWC